jgi:hypothetical protein
MGQIRPPWRSTPSTSTPTPRATPCWPAASPRHSGHCPRSGRSGRPGLALPGLTRKRSSMIELTRQAGMVQSPRRDPPGGMMAVMTSTADGKGPSRRWKQPAGARNGPVAWCPADSSVVQPRLIFKIINRKTSRFWARWPRQMGDCGDNTASAERIRGGVPSGEVGAIVTGRDKQLIRAGYWILLVAMAIQGLTPDGSNVASSWLLRLVTAGLADSWVAGGGPAPSHTPIPRGDHGDVPGEIGSLARAGAALRIRLETGVRPCVDFLPVSLLDRLPRPALGSCDPPGTAMRGSDGLIPSLCRFLC